jgi:hypothetical protein
MRRSEASSDRDACVDAARDQSAHGRRIPGIHEVRVQGELADHRGERDLPAVVPQPDQERFTQDLDIDGQINWPLTQSAVPINRLSRGRL